MNTLEFLERILPHDGIYCLSTISKEGRTVNSFVASQADLEKAGQGSSARVHVYHACASYRTPENRKKSNTQFLRSLWSDVDIRPNPTIREKDKSYTSFEEAFHGLNRFLQESALPTPLIVFSGSGLHLYWPLDEDLPEDKWHKYAEGLKKLITRLKFKVDPGITADSARVLRTPGTINHKNGEICRVLNDAGPYKLSQFNILLIQAAHKPEEAARKYEKDADVEKIVARCQQIAAFKSGVEQTGETWIACGRVLAQCYNADEKLWHEWSAQDDRYIEEEAQKKWEESVSFNNGITCARFRDVNPEGCKGCTQTCKSPVQLGREEKRKELANAVDAPEDVVETLKQVTCPYPFLFDDKLRLCMREKKGEDGEEGTAEVSQYPFYVQDRTTSELEATRGAFIIKHYTPIDKWKSVEITYADFGTAPQAALTKAGIFVTNDKLARDYIRKSINELASHKKMNEIYDTFGWKGDKFLLGERLYYYEKGEFSFDTVHLGSEARSLAPHLRPGGSTGKGDILAWREAAQRLFAPGHEWQATTFLVGCGAPLLALLTDIEGGTIWSLFDPVGGKGKTTATVAAATVWGAWEGLATNSADTMNARMAKLGTLHHLPLAYDEMRRDNPGIAKQFVQAFTAGSERARLDRSAAMARTPRSWRTIMLTSANSELVGAIAADEGSEAMSDRVFEIHAENLPLRKGEINSHLKSEFMVNCGHAGPLIIGLILENLEEVKKTLKEKEAYYMAKLHNSKLRFRAQLVAVVDVVGHIIAKNELLIFDADYYVKWLLEHLMSGQEEKETVTFDAPEYLARFIREFQHSILYTTAFVAGMPKQRVQEPRSGRVAIRVETDTFHIIIPRKDLETWLQSKDQSIRAFIKDMEAKEVLHQKNVKRTLTAGTTLVSGLEYVLIFRGDHELLSGVEKVIPMARALPPQEEEKPKLEVISTPQKQKGSEVRLSSDRLAALRGLF